MELVDALARRGKSVEIETNGTLALGHLADLCRLIVVSPKLENSGVPESDRIKSAVLEELASRDNVVFKFVVEDLADLDEVEVLAARLGIGPAATWIMPEGTQHSVVSQRMKVLAEAVAQRGWALSGRLQLLLWDGRRGH